MQNVSPIIESLYLKKIILLFSKDTLNSKSVFLFKCLFLKEFPPKNHIFHKTAIF